MRVPDHALRARHRARAGTALLALAVVAAACGYTKPPTGVHLADPGKCVAVDVAASPVIASLLADAAARFNGSSAARVRGGCAFVRIETVDAPVALGELTAGWPDAERLGPAPVAWVPGSTMWSQLLDARLAGHDNPSMAPDGASFARTPLVLAMPAPMAGALGYPGRPVTWTSLEQLARDPRGWGAYGHPEWGPFRLGKGNPNWSTTGFDQTIAVDVSAPTTAGAKILEHSVTSYADTTQIYFDNWRRLAATSVNGALHYLSAAIADERSVVAYNSGHLQGDVALTGRGPVATRMPLVAVYPADATIESDNPVITLDAAWTSAAERAGAKAFSTFVLGATTQAAVAAAGFRPGRGPARRDVLSRANGVEPGTRPNAVAPASPRAIEQALHHWQANRRPAHVLVLFDSSESMRDSAVADGPTKMTLAKAALPAAFDQLAPTDDVGLRIFTTKLANRVSPNWLDVVPSGPFATRRAALVRAAAALTPQQGSPLYAATRAAYDTIVRTIRSQRINGIVLLTDGYNEDDHDTNLGALLAHLARNPDVRVFTIAYGNQSDIATLREISQATNAWTYNARNIIDIADVLPRALAAF